MKVFLLKLQDCCSRLYFHVRIWLASEKREEERRRSIEEEAAAMGTQGTRYIGPKYKRIRAAKGATVRMRRRD